MKKLISCVLAVVMCLALLPTSAFAITFSHDKEADELTREELLYYLTTWVLVGGWSKRADELTTEELRTVYKEYLDRFNTYLATTSDWQKTLSSTEGLVAVGPASRFEDVPSDAAYLNELHYAVGNGYISGTGDKTFSPNGNVTRGQFVTILGRMLNVDAANGATQFADVPEKAYYAPFVGWAASKGVVSGTSATTFAPESTISTEQMGTILARYLTNEGKTLNDVFYTHEYADASSISGYAVAGMETMRRYGLITPDANGNVNPQKAVTRAEAAVTLVRLARALGIGVEPTIEMKPVEQSVPAEKSAETIVQTVHDELWAAGVISSSSTEREKATAYWAWLCLNCSYHNSTKYPRRHSATGALVDGVGVCDGLSYAYEKLLKIEGIECKTVVEYKSGITVGHAWVEALLDGSWYKIEAAEVQKPWGPGGTISPEFFELWRAKFFDNPIDSPTKTD